MGVLQAEFSEFVARPLACNAVVLRAGEPRANAACQILEVFHDPAIVLADYRDLVRDVLPIEGGR